MHFRYSGIFFSWSRENMVKLPSDFSRSVNILCFLCLNYQCSRMRFFQSHYAFFFNQEIYHTIRTHDHLVKHAPHLWRVGKASCPLLFKCITFASVHTRCQLCLIDNSIPSIRIAWLHCIQSPMWQYKELKQSLYTPLGFLEAEAPRFQYNRHMKVVRLAAVRTGHLYHQEIFLVLISVRGWVDHRIIVQLTRLCQWRILMKP